VCLSTKCAKGGITLCVSSQREQRLPHTLIATVADRPGVLARIATCCAEKGYNIRSLAVGASERSGTSRMTFVVDASTDALEMVGELQKLDEVSEIQDISAREFVSRELAIVRVQGGKEMRKRLMEIVDIFHAVILDVAPNSMIIEVVGHEHTIHSLTRLLNDYGDVEIVRTGRVSMLRGD
jgi:acetolactate synthase I/III small subunit